MQPKKKRVKLLSDGWYYPQYKSMFFWCPYFDKKANGGGIIKFRDIRFANNFLDKQHTAELNAIKSVVPEQVFEWTPKQ